MSKKLLLINPVQETRATLGSVSLLRVPPASLGYVAALTPSDWDIEVIDENIESLTFEDADLVGLTSYTSNAPRAYEISQQYRRKGIKTVMGGVHASILHDEAIQYVDSVVIGEPESAWPNLIRDFENNGLKRFYRGERTSLENLVRPRMDIYSNKYRTKAFVETARGCPMDCEFCSVTAFYGRTYRQRPIEKVLDELEAMPGKDVFFRDDNIMGYGEKAEQRAIQLFRGMKERGLNKRWFAHVGIDIANSPEVLKWAREAGCLGTMIGFESVNEEALQAMHKVRNLKMGAGSYKEVIKRIHDHGIGVFGAFLLGSDGDRKDVFPRMTEFILDSKIDAAQFTLLTPLPGTRLYSRLAAEGRILRTNYPDDWKHYDFGEAVFRPKHMTPEELEDGVYQVYQQTTSTVTSLKRAFNSFVETRSLPVSVVYYLWNRGYHSISRSKYRSVRNALPSGVKDSCLSGPITDGENCNAEFVECSQDPVKG